MKTHKTDTAKLDLQTVRANFPSLNNDFIFMDNAGGSQTLKGVMDRIVEYLTNYDVQLGASYDVSVQAGQVLKETTSRVASLVNASRPEEVVLGASSTLLFRILSLCLAEDWKEGDEVIVTNSDHEANVSCWTDLRKRGIVVKIWRLNPETLTFDIDDLQILLSKKTKLVTMTHASNIIGTINPVKEIGKVVHEAGALFCVDGVAYAPHRRVDVQELNVDFYVFSFYKVYGPHIAILYGKYDLLKNMAGINHYFIGKEDVPYKFQPGGPNYELTYSLNGIIDYLLHLYDCHFSVRNVSLQQKFQNTFALFAAHEEDLSRKLLDYLLSKPEILIFGSKNCDMEIRVPTIAFIHKKISSDEIVRKVDKYRIGIRHGDFYAKKIAKDFKLEEKNGVVRVSMVHYNTLAEVERLIECFEEIL